VLRGGNPSARQVELDKRLEQAAEGMIEIGKREVTATDLAALTKSRGVEHAVVILQDGKRQLIRLGWYKGAPYPPTSNDYSCTRTQMTLAVAWPSSSRKRMYKPS
jgi:hypothetical protein